jgi:uncharacterized protein
MNLNDSESVAYIDKQSGHDIVVTRCLVLLIFLSICGNVLARAQDACQFGSEEPANSLVKALTQAKSCEAAVKKLDDCRWGSSADTQFAPIVIEKCEKTFLSKLSPTAEKHYANEMQLCAYEYARQEGTISMSEAAMCQVDVAEKFATNPAIANRPEAHASFDCSRAQTALEEAICSDIKLGHADIVLSRVYSRLLKDANKEIRSRLVQDERDWLKDLPGKCGLSSLPMSQQSLNCIRNEFELRFTRLDSCADEDAGSCLQSPAENEKSATVPSASTARASFDCEAPSTALEIVICADAELGQTDIKLAQVYHDANIAISTAQHADLVASERNWLRYVTNTCPLGAIGGIPSVWTRGCVRSAFETRIQQFQICPQKEASQRIPCLNEFRLGPTEANTPPGRTTSSTRVN